MSRRLKSMASAQGLALVSIYVAGIALLGLGSFLGLAKGGSAMAPAVVTPDVEIKIPAIDVNAPAITKTATFAMG